MADQGHGKSRNTERYILAALGGTLAATAIVITISVVLSPGHVSFSVVHASSVVNSTDCSANLTLTISAGILDDDDRRRCAARYQSVFVDLKNSTSPAGGIVIHAQVPDGTFPTEYLMYPEKALINASALVLEEDMKKGGFAGSLNTSGLTVVVRAQVRFKVGAVRTRLYDTKVFFPRVLFPDEGSNTGEHKAKCSAA